MYNDYFGFRLAPFSATPDPDLYYTTRLHDETFATLQYGVMAKKGFVVLTGEVGTGKTTLLHKFLRGLGPTVHSVFIFNTQVNFDELLRLTLKDLGLVSQSNDRATMLEMLNDYLIERLKANHIVCLLIDEAQNLSSESLEGLRLLSNLETDKEKLLQIVLVGQPELEEKLEQRELRQLKQRVALQCRLSSLAKSEVGSYIDFRLKAAGYQGKSLFCPESVERVAFYSGGIPRLINIICDNALLTAYASSQKEISTEVIKEVAADLRLAERMEFQPLPKAATSPPRKESFLETEKQIVPDEVWQLRRRFDEIPAGLGQEQMGPAKKSQAGLKVGTLFTFLLFGGAGALIYSGQARYYLARVDSHLENLIEASSGEKFTDKQQQNIQDNSSRVTAPSAPVSTQNENSEPPLAAEANEPIVEPAPKPIPETDGEERANGPNTVKERAALRVSNDSNIQKKRIETAISQAIHNRAIGGVTVSFVDGTAYLDGEVATERQKSMAERAARSVPDVKSVRNRIDVKFS